MKTPVLHTSRLLLRPLADGDAEEIYKEWSSDSEVAKYMYWEPHISVSETEEWLRLELGRVCSDDWYRWVFKSRESGRLIGTAAFYLDAGSGKHMISYNVSKAVWGNGYTTEAMTEIIRWAVTELGVRQITAEYAKENTGSAKVLEKLGFRFVRDIRYTCTVGRDVYDGVECAVVL